MTYLNSHDEMLPFYEAETAAIHARDPDGARAACAGRSEAMGRVMLAELVRRGVFSPSALAHAPYSCVLNALKPLANPARGSKFSKPRRSPGYNVFFRKLYKLQTLRDCVPAEPDRLD